jgi:SAM-dependent methyltransferase
MVCLEAILDPITTGRLSDLELEAARCLELGAGGGSLARWLVEQVGPSGQVVATDIDTIHISPSDGMTVYQHDLRTLALPEPGPYDLIHARLLLLHLPERQDILRMLSAALAPGGWLLLEEFIGGPPAVLACPSGISSKLFDRVISSLLAELTDHGADMTWGRRMHSAMVAAGLEAVDTIEQSMSAVGGSLGCRLFEINSLQQQEALLRRGITEEELKTFRQLTRDPEFVAMFYQFVSTRARRTNSTRQ